jgi:hypothetical protein
MWSLIGLAVAVLVQTLHTSPEFITTHESGFQGEAVALQFRLKPTPTQATRWNEILEPSPFLRQVQPSPAQVAKPTQIPSEHSQPAFNNRSNKVIQAVAPQAIEHSPALDPCTPSTCPSPTPKPTRAPEPTPKSDHTITPFPTPLVTVIPLPTIIHEPPRCTTIPPHYDKMGPERPLVADPIYCLD